MTMTWALAAGTAAAKVTTAMMLRRRILKRAMVSPGMKIEYPHVMQVCTLYSEAAEIKSAHDPGLIHRPVNKGRFAVD